MLPSDESNCNCDNCGQRGLDESLVVTILTAQLRDNVSRGDWAHPVAANNSVVVIPTAHVFLRLF